MPNTPKRRISLQHGSIEYIVLVPSDLHLEYSRLKDSFSKSLVEVAVNEPSSPAELAGKFLGYVASLVHRNQPGQFDSVLRFSLQDFHSTFLHESDVHSFAVSLFNDANDQYPTTAEKVKENIIKTYYTAIFNSNYKIERFDSNSTNESHQSTKYAVFGGQGNADYFEPLRELYDLYGAFIHTDLLVPVTDRLTQLAKSEPSIAAICTQGLEVLDWLQNPELTPDQDYLLSTPVSCPLITLIQLAYYSVTCKILRLTPGEFRKYLAGSTGHSQGIITSLAIALSDSWDSFIENSIQAVSLMFFIGSRALLSYPRKTIPPAILEDSLENDEGEPSPMLIIRGLSLEQVETFITQTNMQLPIDEQIAISLVNGPTNLVVSGPQESVYSLNLILRNIKAPADLEEATEGKLIFSYKFLPICVPFHSYLLDESYKLIVQDIANAGIDFPLKDVEIPVYDTHNGANFQDYDSTTQEYPLASRVAKLITQLLVNWKAATKFDSADILDLGPGDATGLGTLISMMSIRDDLSEVNER